MDFSLDTNQQGLKKAAIELAEKKLNEGIAERDRKGEFSYEGWKACADFGLQGMMMPKKYGGMELSTLDAIVILEGIGFGCKDNGLIFSVNSHILGCEIPLLHFGTEEQKEKYLPGLCDGSLIGATAMTEAEGGSDIFGIKTCAVKSDGFYILKGSKTFITNAPVADVFLIYAKTDTSKKLSGLSCFIVEKGTPGLTVGKPIEKMGLRTSPMSEVFFDNCKIRKESLLGDEGNGLVVFGDSMEWERIFILASCVGIMDRLLAQAVKYTAIRKSGNNTINKYQAIMHKIADMKLRVEISRLLIQKAAWLKMHSKSAQMEASMAKLYISENCVKSCRDMIQIFGGYGYMVEYELEREMRDALASTIYSGTSEIQKNIIAALSGL